MFRKHAGSGAEQEQIRIGTKLLESLPPVEPPEAIWISIEVALRETKDPARYRWPLVFAVAATVILSVAGYLTVTRSGRMTPGKWIETDAASRITVPVGEIGSVEVQPNTRLRVVADRPQEHRFALLRGEIRAKITAPPKLFFVETASGTAVDLGCEYTLHTDENGLGLLQVTKGWVSFEWKGLESLVPAGAACRTQPSMGPGIPYFEDATERMKQALEQFGLVKSIDGGPDSTFNIILREARVRDTLTLWHLLSRVGPGEREQVFDRIAALTPVPAGVSRELALRLDPETLKRWKDELAWTW
jgi:hypothetical protein